MKLENNNPINELKKEFDDIQNHPNTCTGCTVGLFDKNDYHRWKISLVGAKDSSYSGGLFFLKIVFPNDYPNSLPIINFLTPIYHLNVCPIKYTNDKNNNNSFETLGYINAKFVNNIKPPIRAKEIITKLFALFYENNKENSYYLHERVDEYDKNIDLFKLKARYYTRKYTSIQNLNDIFKYSHKSWDFTYNKFLVKINDSFDKYFMKRKISNISYASNVTNPEESIKLNINMNGINEKIIQCKKKELTKEVINKFLKENNLENKDVLFIFGLRELNFEISIGENGLKDGYIITMISDYK